MLCCKKCQCRTNPLRLSVRISLLAPFPSVTAVTPFASSHRAFLFYRTTYSFYEDDKHQEQESSQRDSQTHAAAGSTSDQGRICQGCRTRPKLRVVHERLYPPCSHGSQTPPQIDLTRNRGSEQPFGCKGRHPAHRLCCQKHSGRPQGFVFRQSPVCGEMDGCCPAAHEALGADPGLYYGITLVQPL